MEPIQGSPRRSSEHLAPGGGGEDRISDLDDDLLLLVLARLGCVRAAARTGVLSRRWRGLWAILRHIVIRDVPFPSLEAALRGVHRPPPGLSLVDIRVPDREPRGDAAGVTSLLSAAALFQPKELVLALPSGYNNSPMFFLQLPADVNFPALETLSLSGCHVRFESFLPWCPRLRVLRVKFNDHAYHDDIETFMSVHSGSLQELFVEAKDVLINTVDLVLPELKHLTVSLKADEEVNISISAPMADNISWQWSYFTAINFGPWRIRKLRLRTAASHGELPSLRIHARIVRLLFMLNLLQAPTVRNFVNDVYLANLLFQSSSVAHGGVENSTQEIEKHLIITEFYVLELYLKTKGHVFGALVFHLLGMNPRFRRTTRRLIVTPQQSAFTQGCPLDCPCDHPDWRSQIICLTDLEEVEIVGFEGYDHELDFLKMIFKSAPMLKRMSVGLLLVPTSMYDRCTQIHNISMAYSSVECFLYVTRSMG